MYKNQKLSYEDKIHIAKDIVGYGLSVKYVTKLYGISVRWAEIIAKEYRETGRISPPKKRGRREYRYYSEQLDSLIIELHKRYRVGAVLIGKIMRERYGIWIDNNHIHEVLKMNGYAKDEPKKRGRKKPWIRYERTHSLDAVHMDWHYDEKSGL